MTVVKACPTCAGQGEILEPAQAGRPVPPEHVRTVPCPEGCENGEVEDNPWPEEVVAAEI